MIAVNKKRITLSLARSIYVRVFTLSYYYYLIDSIRIIFAVGSFGREMRAIRERKKRLEQKNLENEKNK